MRVTFRFSFRTDLGSIVHHDVLNSSSYSSNYNSAMSNNTSRRGSQDITSSLAGGDPLHSSSSRRGSHDSRSNEPRARSSETGSQNNTNNSQPAQQGLLRPSRRNSNDTQTTTNSQQAHTEVYENLMFENAELKRSLQILQAGVVESMKGNKARFMGGHLLRT